MISRPFGSVTQSWDATSQLTEKDISPHFWPNGTMPNSQEFDLLVKNDFADYRLRIGGLVENPAEFSYAALKASRHLRPDKIPKDLGGMLM